MDAWKRAQAVHVLNGGYRCDCCGYKQYRNGKRIFAKRARMLLKQQLRKENSDA